MQRPECARFLRLLLLLTLVGCRSTPDPYAAAEEGQPLTQEELRHFLARAKDPRRFFITTYDSEDGPVFTGVNRLHDGQVAELPFRSKTSRDAPLVTVKARTPDEYTALLDSTTGRSWLDLPSSWRMHATPLNPGDTRTPRHLPDILPGYAGILSSLRLDQLYVENALVYIRAAKGSLGPLGRGVTQPPPRIVLGTDLLRSFQYVQVDYPARHIVFSATASYRPSEADLLTTLPAQYVHGALAGQGAVNGQPTPLLIDTAGDFSLVIPHAATGTIWQVSLGDVVFRRPSPVTTASGAGLGLNAYPRIGRRLLNRYRVTIADHGRLIYLERPGITH